MKKFIIILSFISFNAFAAATSSKSDVSSDRAEQINDLYEIAEKRIYNNEYDKALKLLINLTKNDDLGIKKADVYNLLGFSYRKSSNPDLDKSYNAYMTALEYDPKHAGAHEYLGELYMMRGETEKAMNMLDKLENLVGKNANEYKDLLKAIKSYQS
tara:strand:- start:28 stop:498 length:471 start_codon:yes stop_codon:yes gene_type:complete